MNSLQQDLQTGQPASGSGTRTDSGGCVSLLRMAVGTEVLAVPIAEVHEILQVARMTPLPRTPAFVRGVMNLRGAVVPVIDLAARLGQPAAEIGRRSCIVVVRCHGSAESAEADAGEGTECDDPGGADGPLTVGLLVDAVFEVFDRHGQEIEAVPPLGTRIDPEHLRGMTRAAGALVGVLALARVLAPRELTAAIAAHRPLH